MKKPRLPRYAFANKTIEELNPFPKAEENIIVTDNKEKKTGIRLDSDHNMSELTTRITVQISSSIDQKLEYAAIFLRKKKGVLINDLLSESLNLLDINFPKF